MAPTHKPVRIGLATVARKTTVRADDTSPEAMQALDNLLLQASPEERLRRIKAWAQRHPQDEGLAGEIETVSNRLKENHGRAEREDLEQMLAIERGLVLLDANALIPALVTHAKTQAARKRGHQAQQRLPDGPELLRLVDEVRKQAVCERYGVGIRAVNKAVAKAKKEAGNS